MDLVDHGNAEDERRFKNLATKVLSNGVEVLVKDKNDGKQEQVNYCNIIFLTSFFQANIILYFDFELYLFIIICIMLCLCSLQLLFSQRKLKLMHVTSFKPPYHHVPSPSKSLLSSAVATFFNHQQMDAIFPLHQLTQHNYIIKTCMTTYTYLTTVVQNKRSDISTFETIVSVITTESLTNLPVYATDIFPDIKPTNVRSSLNPGFFALGCKFQFTWDS